MHRICKQLLRDFKDFYLKPDAKIDILDIGSCDFNGNIKSLFQDNTNWSYMGADIRAGENVDVLMHSDYDWRIPNTYDLIISSNTMEHVNDVKLWIQQIPSLLTPGGLVCIDVPFFHGLHRSPERDCWRFLPDGLRWLLVDICQLEMIDTFYYTNDCIGIARDTRTLSNDRFNDEALKIKPRGFRGDFRGNFLDLTFDELQYKR
jgi:SAM-dependent methyltransferase